MLKRVFCIATSLTLFLIISFSPLRLSSHASKYEHIAPYSDFKFSADTSQFFYPNGFYDGQIDFYFIVATAEGSSFKFRLFTVRDNKSYHVLKIQRDVLPLETLLLSSDYSIYSSSFVLPSSDGVVEFDTIQPFNYNVVGLVFDYYNAEKYPSYNGSSTYAILASNVDIYDYDGRLLQCGNYDTFLKYFDYNLDASKIKDYTSASEPQSTTTAPAVTTTPSGSGSSGDDETSKGIFDTLKNVFLKLDDIFVIVHKISDFFVDLPHLIAEMNSNFQDTVINAIKGFFQDIKDGLIYLFVPTDNNNFAKCKEIIDTKFAFVNQIKGFYENIINRLNVFTDEPPVNRIDFRPYYNFDVEFVNWDIYNKYKSFIDKIIVFCAWFIFFRRIYKQLPGIIGGFHV